MRKLLILLAVIAIAAVAYHYRGMWTSLNASTAAALSMPDASPTPVPDYASQPYALRLWGRVKPDSMTLRRQVVFVNGDRWRLESKDSDSSKITVAVCDGTRVVGNAAASRDPRPMIREIFAASKQLRDDAAQGAPTDACDGHDCLKGNADIDGIDAQLWVDAGSGFPVFFVNLGGGKFADEHFERIPINFADPATAEYFDVKHTESILEQYLNP
jgi:hypothetical protein